MRLQFNTTIHSYLAHLDLTLLCSTNHDKSQGQFYCYFYHGQEQGIFLPLKSRQHRLTWFATINYLDQQTLVSFGWIIVLLSCRVLCSSMDLNFQLLSASSKINWLHLCVNLLVCFKRFVSEQWNHLMIRFKSYFETVKARDLTLKKLFRWFQWKFESCFFIQSKESQQTFFHMMKNLHAVFIQKIHQQVNLFFLSYFGS